MKSRKCNRIFSLLVTAVMILSLITTVPVHVWASNSVTYYVDSIKGNDKNKGTSTGAAWKTLAKVNGTTFKPGDRILFKAGCTWNGQLWPKGSGENGKPIIIDMYGKGSKPLINGSPIKLANIRPTDFAADSQAVVSEPESTMPNLVINPGLETGDKTGWDGWGEWFIDKEHQRSGSYCAKVPENSSAEQVVKGLKPDTTYRLKVWARVVSATDQVCLGVKDHDGSKDEGVYTSSLTYTQLSIDFTTGHTNTTAKIYLWYSATHGCAYGDDFQLQELVTDMPVDNPGFETGDKTGWESGDSWTVVKDNPHEGSYCARLPVNSSAEHIITGLTPNTYYRFSAWAKVENPSDVVYLGVKDYGSQEISKKTSSKTYVQLYIDFVTGPEEESAKIYFKRNSAGSGNAYADDAGVKLLPKSLIRTDDPLNKISNPEFETGVMSPWAVSDGWSVVNDNQYRVDFCAQINPGAGMEQVIKGLLPNRAYRITAWVKVANSSSIATLGVKDYGGHERIASSTSSTDYRQLGIDFTTGPNNTTATVYLRNDGSSGYAYADDFDITGTGSQAFKLRNQSYWEVNNLQVTNWGPDGIELRRRAVFVEAADAGTVRHIYFKNLYIHDVNGGDETHSNLDYESGGISMLVNDDPKAPDKQTKFDDVLIEGCTFKNVSKEGIFISNNVYRVRGGFTFENTPRAKGTWYPSTNVRVRNNSLDTIGGDGIVLAECKAPLIEYNVAKDCHNDPEFWQVAIWSINCDDSVIQYNEAYGTKTINDGEGFDVDWNQNRTIMQYNYSHDNEGGFLLMCCWQGESFTKDSIVRYNISQNDLTRGFEIHGDVKNSKIYNNTIYVKRGLTTKVVNLDISDERYPSNTFFYNNIFYNLGNGGYNTTNCLNTVFDYNCFYGKHPGSEPEDAHKITADPYLVNPGTGGKGRKTLDGYKLQPYSPCIDAGKDMTGNGGKDYWGNKVPYKNSKTDIGACEYQGRKTSVPADLLKKAALPSKTRSNILTVNPGFETGGKTGGWDENGAYEVVKNNAHTGSYCVKVTLNSSAERVVSGLKPDTDYTVKAWIKVETPEDGAYLGVKDYGYDDTALKTSSTSYKQLSVDFTTGASNTTAKIYLWRDGSGTGHAYGDDFEIIEN